MSLPDDVLRVVESAIGAKVLNARSVGGGCIARATSVQTSSDRYFLKFGATDLLAALEAEYRSLGILSSARTDLIIPNPIAFRQHPPMLLMEWLDGCPFTEDTWHALGRGLAGLHRAVGTEFGLSFDNFIGRIPQVNSPSDSWVEFFVTRRLEPQVRHATDVGVWKSSWTEYLQNLLARLPSILPSRPQISLVHGDLWSGNCLALKSGAAAVFDPAAYFGHREVDLALAELFGGFGRGFFAAYDEAWPTESGYEERRDIYNLYHLINHLSHFGGAYSSSVEGVLRRFGK